MYSFTNLLVIIVRESQSPALTLSRSQSPYSYQHLSQLITLPISLHSPHSHVIWFTVCYAILALLHTCLLASRILCCIVPSIVICSTAPMLLWITCKRKTPVTIQLRIGLLHWSLLPLLSINMLLFTTYLCLSCVIDDNLVFCSINI